jgi:hypothetical protein
MKLDTRIKNSLKGYEGTVWFERELPGHKKERTNLIEVHGNERYQMGNSGKSGLSRRISGWSGHFLRCDLDEFHPIKIKCRQNSQVNEAPPGWCKQIPRGSLFVFDNLQKRPAIGTIAHRREYTARDE